MAKEKTTKETKERKIRVPISDADLKVLNINPTGLETRQIVNTIRAKMKLPEVVRQTQSALLREKLGLPSDASNADVKKAMLDRLK